MTNVYASHRRFHSSLIIVDEDKQVDQEVSELVGMSIARVAGSPEADGRAIVFRNPKKLAAILVDLGKCVPSGQIIRKHGVNKETLARIRYDHQEELGGLRRIFGREMGANALVASDTVLGAFEDYEKAKLAWERDNPDTPFPTNTTDIKNLAMSLDKMANLALVSNNEATSITEDRRKLTIEDAKQLREQLLGKSIEAETVE